MSCYDPLLAVDYGVNPETQKKKIKILPRRVDLNIAKMKDLYGSSLLLLPCGHCLGCIQDYRQSWAVRILLESTLYAQNCFITLTYRDECLPKDNRPHRDEIVKFFKRLRKEIGVPIRYFYCGEKGSSSEGTHRAHYHAIIFGYDFPDKFDVRLTSKGSQVFRSRILEKCWTFGLSSVGEVEPASACYVAMYADKKKFNQEDDGSFVGMSRMPGLGCSNFNMKWFKSDTIYCALGEASIPRFYQKMLEGINPAFFNEWKEARKERASKRVGTQYEHGFLNQEEDFSYNENIKLINYLRRMTYASSN